MEAEERERVLEHSNILRSELKAWERDFAAASGGRKAGRDDIKQHPTIAQKYKDYNRTRDVLSGKSVSQASSSPQKETSRKRKQETAQASTPCKRLQITQTPSKCVLHPAAVDPYDSPSLVRTLFTPSNRVIGPTPQKDGHVLGLFDLLSDHDESSPSKTHIIITGPDGVLQATPRKPNVPEDIDPRAIRCSKTPASSGKRFMLDSFVTPLKKRHQNEEGKRTPSSISTLNFSTPSFLRRDSQRMAMPPIQDTENGRVISPQVARVPRKPIVRGLSSILAGLRKMEEEAADDDLDALREMENEAGSPIKPTELSKETVLAEDYPRPILLGGFDDEAMYDSEPEDISNPPVGQDGKPFKTWKKKGQKRTTRRVVMKPVLNRSHPQTFSANPVPTDGLQLDDNLKPNEDKDEVPELKPPSSLLAEAGNFDSDSASEYTASEGGTRYRRPNQEKKHKARRYNEDGSEGKVRKVLKKVGATAHANFKRLKLRNLGAKGGPGHGSRFRRRK